MHAGSFAIVLSWSKGLSAGPAFISLQFLSRLQVRYNVQTAYVEILELTLTVGWHGGYLYEQNKRVFSMKRKKPTGNAVGLV